MFDQLTNVTTYLSMSHGVAAVAGAVLAKPIAFVCSACFKALRAK